jgi:PAS domain S-box-containing protein
MRSIDELALIATIADGLPCGVWVAAAPGGEFVYANAAFDQIMGMGPVADVRVGEYTAPYGIYGRDGALYPEHRLPFVRALQERTTVVVDDLVIHRRDGRRVYVRAVGKPMIGESGEITHVSIAFFDITREAEAQVARSCAEERLRSAVSGAPIILFALDREGTISFVDGRGLARLSISPDDLVGKSALDAATVGGSSAVRHESIRRALAGEVVSYLARPPHGVFDTQLAPLRDDAGEIVGVIGVSTDVTDRHAMQQQLARAERLASVGLLAAGVAHEVNNPLSFVIGNLDLIAAHVAQTVGAPDRTLTTLIGMVRDARVGAERVRTIVRDLKTFARVGEQRLDLLDVRAPLEAAIAMARNEIRHRAALEVALAPVPGVLADEGRLAQVFLNLLVNAAHSIPEGAAEKNKIRVTTCEQPDGAVCVEVSDTGAGIDPAHVANIFDPFFTTKDVGYGTGLGLSICHGVVSDLGGRIDVESTPGRGSTFRVVFPRAPAALVQSAPRQPGEPVARRPGPRTVLVIDDERVILDVVRAMLEEEHQVTCESRADAALARVRAGERFHAILCDLMMPQMTGMDVYEALLEIAPAQAQALVFFTGGAFTPAARAFLARVPNRIIEKPFDSAALRKALERF